MVVISESPSYVILLATGPEPGISLQDEDLLSPAVQRQPLLLSESALGPLLEALRPPHHLTTTVNKQTKPTLVVLYRTDHCHLCFSLSAVYRLIFQFAELLLFTGCGMTDNYYTFLDLYVLASYLACREIGAPHCLYMQLEYIYIVTAVSIHAEMSVN